MKLSFLGIFEKKLSTKWVLRDSYKLKAKFISAALNNAD
jgi:hypothetical protein